MATYADLMRSGAKRLDAAGIESPVREARLLMGLAAKLDSAGLIAREPEEINSARIETCFEAFVARRAAHEPFAHIAGERSFYGLDFISDARALVPRPDSEIVVETALALLPPEGGVTLADLGTGSGCLLAALLDARGDAIGQAIEKDPEAASLARENFTQLGLGDRVILQVTDWADWTGWGAVDLIISNPPYIARAEIETLAPDVARFDPRPALDGGTDGLVAYRVIIALAAAQMKPGAWLVFEIGYDQKQAVSDLLKEAGFMQIQSARDLGGNDRVISARKTDG